MTAAPIYSLFNYGLCRRASPSPMNRCFMQFSTSRAVDKSLRCSGGVDTGFFSREMTKARLGSRHGKPISSKHTVEEAYKYLGISPNKDGSFNREIKIPMVNATPFVNDTNTAPIALSKDIYLHTSQNQKSCLIRLYRPLQLPQGSKKIPLVIYFHGGDFVLYSATTIVFHNFCNHIAFRIPAIVASVEYRLAPEHRLPAAYDDAVKAIVWAKQQALGTNGTDPWLEKVDFTRVFLLGSSSGGNIAYHAALRSMDIDLDPIKIQGIIINQPYFGGVERTESELRLINDPFVPLYVNDALWTLALPKDANRDHEFCNPLSLGSPSYSRVKRLPQCLVKGNTGDPLVDRGTQFVKFLESNGVGVNSVVVEGGGHGIELSNVEAAEELYDIIKNFIHSL